MWFLWLVFFFNPAIINVKSFLVTASKTSFTCSHVHIVSWLLLSDRLLGQTAAVTQNQRVETPQKRLFNTSFREDDCRSLPLSHGNCWSVKDIITGLHFYVCLTTVTTFRQHSYRQQWPRSAASSNTRSIRADLKPLRGRKEDVIMWW